MANFQANYDEMDDVAAKLKQAKIDIADILKEMKGAVKTLTDNGFKTEVASGQFNDGYEELSEGLDDASDGIDDMSKALKAMRQGIQDTDAGLLKK